MNIVLCYSVGGMTEANIKFTTNKNPKQSDIPAAMTLPVDRYVDIHVTGSELVGVESDEPLRVLRMTGTSEGDDDDDDDDDCAIEFEVVEPFQPQSMIQAFASALGGRDATQTTVWLLVDVNLLKSDKLSIDEINVLDSHNDAESLEVRGANYSAVRMTLTRGFHIVAAVSSDSAVTPQLDLFQYIYVPESGHGNPPRCVAEVICGRRDGVGASPGEFTAAGVEKTALRSLIDSYPVNDAAALSASQQQDRRSTAASSGDESAAGISPIPARIGVDKHARINRRTTTETSGDHREPHGSRVTDADHKRVGDGGDKTRNQSSLYNVSATAPESVNVPYVVHPMVSGDRPAESYVVKIGSAADDLAASGPQGPPVWRTGSHDELSSEPVSPTVIAVLTSLGVAIFFVIICILGFVVSELVCGESGYGRARLLGKHGARVSPYYVD